MVQIHMIQHVAKLIVVFVLGAIIFVAHNRLTAPQKIDLQQIAHSINQEANLPMEITKGVRVERIEAQNNQLIFKYTLTDYDGITVKTELMQQVKQGMTLFMCQAFGGASAQSQSAIRQQITSQAIVYYVKLYNKNNVFLNSTTINLTSCVNE